MSYRHKKNPRLINSHWDLDDEFINLSMPEATNYLKSSVDLLDTSRFLPHFLSCVGVSAIAVLITYWVMSTRRTERRPFFWVGAKRKKHASDECSPTKRGRRVLGTLLLKQSKASQKIQEHFSTVSSNSFSPTRTEPGLVKELRDCFNKQQPSQIRDDSRSPSAVTTTLSNRNVRNETVIGNRFRGRSNAQIRRLLASSDSSLSTRPEDVETIEPSNEINSSLSTRQSEELATIELANEIKRTAEILEKEGLGRAAAETVAMTRVLDKSRLNEKEESSRRIMIEGKKLDAGLKACELQVTGARHEEMKAVQRLDRNWMKSSIESRNDLLTNWRCTLLFLLCFMMLDRVCKTESLELLRNVVSCQCSPESYSIPWTQSMVSWDNIRNAFNWRNVVHATSMGCWLSCFVPRCLAIGPYIFFLLYKGISIQVSLAITAVVFIVYNGGEEVKIFLTYCATVLCGYCLIWVMVWFRHRSFQKRMEKQTDSKTYEDYVTECDNSKALTYVIVAASIAAFQVTTQGFVLTFILDQLQFL